MFRGAARFVARNPRETGYATGAIYNYLRNRKRRRSSVSSVPSKRRSYKVKQFPGRKRYGLRHCKDVPRKTKKCIKEIVKRAISKSTAEGYYMKNYSGQILMPGPGVETQVVSDQFFTDSGATLKGRLKFFCPNQFKDAASVLFNGKTAALAETTTGDFTNVELKFNVIYASATAVFKNNFLAPIEFTLYEVTSKNLEGDYFTDEYDDALEATNINQVGGSTVTKSDLHVTPTMLAHLKQRYTIKPIKKLLQPGQTYTHFMKTANNWEFSLQKYYDNTQLKPISKMSKQLMYEYKPQCTPIFDSFDSLLKSGYAYRTASAGTSTMGCLTVEVSEKFKLDPPPSVAVANNQDALCVFNAYDAVSSIGGNVSFAKDYSYTNSPYFVADT